MDAATDFATKAVDVAANETAMLGWYGVIVAVGNVAQTKTAAPVVGRVDVVIEIDVVLAKTELATGACVCDATAVAQVASVARE